MMEIKVRAWDKTGKKMKYLNKQHDTFMFEEDGGASYYNLQNGSGGSEYELMQYTGLCDKSGHEIYEDDIWVIKGAKYIITWMNDYARFVPVRMDGCGWIATWSKEMAARGLVIGNIHQDLVG